MSLLTSQNTSTLLSAFTVFLSLGTGIFIVAMAILIVLYGWSLKDTLKNAKGIVAVFVMMFVGTTTLTQITNKSTSFAQASMAIKINLVDIMPVADKTVRVTVTTSIPVSGYLEYYDYSRREKNAIVSTIEGPSDKQVFYIYNVGDKGGEAALTSNKQRILFENGPIYINAN